MTETRRLEEQKVKLDARLAELQAENARLAARFEALRSSPEAARLEARALGYFETGEVPVRTLGGAEFRLPADAPHLSRIPPLAGEDASPLFFRLAWPLLLGVFWGFLHLMPRLRARPAEGLAAVEKLPAPAAPERLPAPWFGLDLFRK